jgi:hypothetical protein
MTLSPLPLGRVVRNPEVHSTFVLQDVTGVTTPRDFLIVH